MTIGIFEFTDGGIYDGQLKNNNFHGKGTLTETKGKNAGEVYKGTWKDGKKNGRRKDERFGTFNKDTTRT